MIYLTQKHLLPWDGNGFLNRSETYAPWYDDKADYNTNAKSYYDYLARVNRFLQDVVTQINRLLDRDLAVEDTKTIDLTKVNNWLDNEDSEKYDDVIKLSADLIVSKATKEQVIQYTGAQTFDIKNATQVMDDGVWTPDYLPLFSYLFDAIGRLTVSNSYATLRRLGSKYRDQNSGASNAQGFCALDNNIGIQYFQNIGAGLDRTKGDLVRFNLDTGTELARNTIIGQHGNSMTYNKKENAVYLTEDYGQGSSRLLKIDPNTLEITDYIDLADTMTVTQVHSVGYDLTDDIYVVADNNIMNFYDHNFNLLFVQKWSDIVGFTPDYMQGVQCNGNLLYWLGGHKGQIFTYKIDVENKRLQFNTSYYFDNFQENIYPLGEMEALGFNNKAEKIYVASHISTSNYTGLTEYFVTGQDFRAIMTKGSLVLQNNLSSLLQSNIYVSKNTNYSADGTIDNPFNNLLEAQNVMLSPDIKFPSLVIQDDFENQVLSLANVQNAMVTTAGKKVQALNIVNCSNIYIATMVTDGYTSWRDKSVYIWNSSDIKINSLTCNNMTDNTKDAFYAERSTINVNFLQTNLKIHILNSRLTTNNNNITDVIKESVSSSLYGFKKLPQGKINEITDPEIKYYSKIKAIVFSTINDKSVNFKLTGYLDSNNINLRGLSINTGTIYICDFKYVVDKPETSTITFYSLPDGKQIDATDYNVQMFIGD